MCMKSTISAESLILLFGTVAPANSKREHKGKEKRKSQQRQQQHHAKPCSVK
jgi:hypothetical protein